MDNVVRYASSEDRAPHSIIISSGDEEPLAPNPAQPRNAASAGQMPAPPPEATDGNDSLIEGNRSFTLAEERKEAKGAQHNGWRPPFQESGQENRAVDRNSHGKTTEGGGRQKNGHGYEGRLRMKRTLSLSFNPGHNVSGESGPEGISSIDDASWEVIDYPSCLV